MYTRHFVLLIFVVATFCEGTIRLSEKTTELLEAHLLRSGLTELRSYLSDIVDEVIKKIRPYIATTGYDPVKVGDVHKSFKWGIFYGRLDLVNGTLWNLSTLHRIGDIKFKVHEKQRYIALSVPVGFDDLRYISDYSVKIVKIGPSGNLKSKVTEVKTNTTLNLQLNSNVITLDKFNITEAGDITVCFSESSMDWMLNMLSKYTIPRLHDHIINSVQDAMSDFLNKTLIDKIYI